MKKIILLAVVLLSAISVNKAQSLDRERYGNTLNLGAGIGYGYVGRAIPFGTLNYEVDIARNFTLAPFIGVYSYRNDYYWGNPNKPFNDESYRYYSYRETVIPVGLKGAYYFDELFRAGPKWDFYAAASVGFNIRNRVWDSGYAGDIKANQTASPLYLNIHVGSEYHMTDRVGAFLDLSTGVSTVGLAFHF